jgi:hypothetical protein
MKQILVTLTVLLLTCGVTYGQDEPGPGSEHLKAYGPMLGTWRYKGPLLEDVPGIAEQGTKLVVQASWRRILNKSAVEYNWSVTFEGGTEFSGKALIGWNADEEKIVYGSMNSIGDLNWGTVTPDDAAKALTKTGKDTLTLQALERTGGIVEGPGPAYSYKRVERAKKAAK